MQTRISLQSNTQQRLDISIPAGTYLSNEGGRGTASNGQPVVLVKEVSFFVQPCRKKTINIPCLYAAKHKAWPEGDSMMISPYVLKGSLNKETL